MLPFAGDTILDAISHAPVSKCAMHGGHNGTSHGAAHNATSPTAMMNMYLTTAYANYPVLFKRLSARDAAQLAGICVLVFVAAFLLKAFEFVKNYLEHKVWLTQSYQVSQTTIIQDCECDEPKKGDVSEATLVQSLPSAVVAAGRNAVRLVLCFVSETLGYAMMLVAMTFSLAYFFAVVGGMASGRVFFERLSDRLNVRPGGNNFQGHH